MDNQVPGLNNTPQFSENVPGVQFPFRQEFGKLGQGLATVGKGVESLAHTGGEIYDEIQRQQDISTAQSNAVQMDVAHSKMRQDLTQVSPDGFMHDEDSGEIVKNADGSQRTIAHEYWDRADADYQERQKNMSPRAAAMFRQETLEKVIGQNTKLLQLKGLELQRADSNQKVSDAAANFARDNDRSPWSDVNPYYSDKREDGSINLRGNTDKINDQLRTLKLWTAQQGPVNGAPGMFNPTEVQEHTAKRLSQHANDWVQSAATDIVENDTPRDHKNHISTTAMQQVLNLRDVIEGKDPQSARAQKFGMPTVASSLTSDQRDKWRNHLNSMLDQAQKIDRSDYDFQLQQMKEKASSGYYSTPDKFFASPEMSYLKHASEPLGLTPEKSMHDMSEVFVEAAKGSVGGAQFDLASDSSKQAQIRTAIGSYAKAWQQWGQMNGVKFTESMQGAVSAQAEKAAVAKITEDTRQYREDPAKFAASPASGYQDPQRGVKYRSPTMHAVEEHLFSDPSIFAPLKPLANGQPVIVAAAREMKKIGTMGFGAGFEPGYLSKDAYQAWANKIEKSNNPAQAQQMFDQLKKTAGPDAGTVMNQLVQIGHLNPRYQTAFTLPSSQAQTDAIADIQSKGSAVKLLADSQNGEDTVKAVKQIAVKALQGQLDFNHKLYGADNPLAAQANTGAVDTWSSAYATARLAGRSREEATQAANERIQAQMPPTGVVQDQHHFLGMSFGSAGPATHVRFSRPDLSTEQQQTIQSNLLTAQKADALQRHEIVPAPVKPGEYNFNPKLDAKWVSEHPFIWYPVRQGSANAAYRLMYQGINADGSPNGRGYDLRVFDGKGNPTYYEVKESEALKKQGP